MATQGAIHRLDKEHHRRLSVSMPRSDPTGFGLTVLCSSGRGLPATGFYTRMRANKRATPHCDHRRASATLLVRHCCLEFVKTTAHWTPPLWVMRQWSSCWRSPSRMRNLLPRRGRENAANLVTTCVASGAQGDQARVATAAEPCGTSRTSRVPAFGVEQLRSRSDQQISSTVAVPADAITPFK